MSKRTSPYFTRVLWHLTDINWLPFSSLRKHSFRGNLDSVPAEQHPPASSPVPGAKLLPQLIPFWVPPGVHIRWPSNEWKDLRLFIVSCLPACILYIYAFVTFCLILKWTLRVRLTCSPRWVSQSAQLQNFPLRAPTLRTAMDSFAWSWDSHGQIVAVFAILGPASRAARRDSWAICQWLQALPTWSKLIKPLSFGSGSNFDSYPHCSNPNFLRWEAEATAAS